MKTPTTQREAVASSDLFAGFDRDTIFQEEAGQYSIDCRMGLWGVCGSDLERVKSSAMHYYLQYYADGEYSSANDEWSDPAQRAGFAHTACSGSVLKQLLEVYRFHVDVAEDLPQKSWANGFPGMAWHEVERPSECFKKW